MGEVDDITCSIRAEHTKHRGQEGKERPRRAANSAYSPCCLTRCKFFKSLPSTSLTHSSVYLFAPTALHRATLTLSPPPTPLGCCVSLWLPCLPPVKPSQDLWVSAKACPTPQGWGGGPCSPLRRQLSAWLPPPVPGAPSVELFLIPPPAPAVLEILSVSS